jgi:hypothetical protein
VFPLEDQLPVLAHAKIGDESWSDEERFALGPQPMQRTDLQLDFALLRQAASVVSKGR